MALRGEKPPGQGEALAMAPPPELVGHQQATQGSRHEPGGEMARTLDVEDEQGGEDAAEEEPQYKIGAAQASRCRRPRRLPSDQGSGVAR